jgi:amino acid adenylation domain-containing protein
MTEPGHTAPPSGWYEFPPSFAQKRLWVLHQLEPQSPAYNVPWFLRLTGELDRSALETSLCELVRRHESLRTTFPMRDGEPVQQIHLPGETGEFTLPLVDLSQLGWREREEAARALRQREATCPFDLGCGPLIRFSLVRLADREHELLVTMHHIVSDGWSKGVLMRELCALYEAFLQKKPSPLPEPTIQYADYSVWQRELVQSGVFERQLEYWSQRLADVPLLDLPTHYPRSQATSRPGAVVTFSVPGNVSERLQDLKQSEGATSFIVLLAAFQWLLGLYANQEDVSVGTVIASRSRKDTENLVGLLLNTLVLRADLGGAPSFRELIGRVRKVVLEAYANQDAPFDQILKGLRPQRMLGQDPLLQVVFILENGRNEPSYVSGLHIEEISAELDRAKFEVLLALQETPEGLQGDLQYAADIFDRQSMEQMARQYRRLIEIASAEPDTPLTSLSLIEGEDWQNIQNWNRTERAYPSEQSLQELFERQVEADPQALALVQGGSRLTYSDLNRRANQLAHYLRSRAVGPEVPVGLCLERGVEMVVAILAIVKAGGVYVPLDPTYPADRLEQMIADTALPLVITEDAFLGRFWDLPPDTVAVSMESLRDELTSLSPENPPRVNSGDDLAYVIYTSGSTGAPKGIMVPHRAVTRLVINTDYVDLRPGDRVAQVSNASFDAATFEVWGALLNGAALVIIDKDIALSPAEFGRQLQRERVTAMFLTAALFNQTIQADREVFRGVRYLLVGGEALDPRWIAEALGEMGPEHLLNGYGPTETTTFATWFPVREVEEGCRTIPIGGPIANTRAYVLDEYLQPMPPGLPGEIYLGGPGVARGYWGNPELTAERFVPDPFSSQGGQRLYRTGDRALYRRDGAIEFLGRTDDQVKLRGYRIELGEIEASLKRHEAVKDAVVVLREDDGEKRLVGYVVAKPGETLAGSAVREWLKKRLPDYMTPSAVVALGELPLNANGKVDRQTLPPPSREDRELEEYAGPRTELEERLCRIWAETLQVERVGITDNFFELGGHSLLAMRVISKTNDLLKLEIPLRTLFEFPTVVEFAVEVDVHLREGSSTASSIKRVSRDGPLPLSPAQQRLWFLNQLQPESGIYNVPLFLCLIGDLNRVALERSFSEIIRRHEVLRTDFPAHLGEPTQQIQPARPITIPLADLSALDPDQRERAVQELRREEANRPFDLSRGPLMRARLLRLREQEHELLLTLHHIVTDGWSQGILVNELRALYEAYHASGDSPLPELKIQYADYAAWQRDWLQSEELLRQLDYWRKQLDGVPVLEMPTDYIREQLAGHPQGTRPVHLSAKLVAGLKQLSRREGATLFMALMAGFQWLLSRYARQKDVAVGTIVANRNRLELENLIGFFVNTLVFRVDASGALTFRQFLRQGRETALQAYAHQDMPFEKLVEELNPDRDLGGTPFFQAFMALQNAPAGSWDLPGLRVEDVNAELREAKFDLSLMLIESESGVEGQLSYAADLFAPESIDQIIQHYANLLERAVVQPDVPLATIELLSADERRQIVVEWNCAARTYPGELAPEAFETQARRAPKAPALEFQGVRLTYQEMDERSNRLARHLLERGLVREMCVGIGLERGIDWAVAILAVWKAGGVYMPLDITHPKDRLAFMLEEAKVGMVLSEVGMLDDLPPHPSVICLDEDWELIERQSAERPAIDLRPEQLAYVMYTSGSAGKPKGVMIEHGGMINHLRGKVEGLGLQPEDIVAQNASASFDVSVWQLFAPLIAGAKAQIIGEEISRHPFDLFEEVNRLEITVLETVPTLLGAYLDDPGDWEFKRLRCLISNAEPLPVSMCERWASLYPGIRLLNTYGATECSDDVTHQTVDLSGSRNLTYATLGTPLPNLTVYVLDEEMRPVPYGVAGELCLGGFGVGRGYLSQPALTAMRFVPDPFSQEPGRRLYRTGDLGRLNRDGSLEFLERMDFQVKLRGHRVELGEIESAALEHDGVGQAVVLLREDEPGDKRLVAYIVPSRSAKQSPEAMPASDEADDLSSNSLPLTLRDHLTARLPAYMAPDAYVILDELPLTVSGKLDRLALPKPESGISAAETFVAPRNEVETEICSLWASLLRVERVGVNDNFFALGGHSLLATQVISQVREHFRVEVPLAAVFRSPTVVAFALELERARGAKPTAPIVAANRADFRSAS